MSTEAGEFKPVDAVVASDNEPLKPSSESDNGSQQDTDAAKADSDAEEQPKSGQSTITQLFAKFPFRPKGRDEDKARGQQGDKRNQTTNTTKPKTPPATAQTKDPKAPTKPKKPTLA